MCRDAGLMGNSVERSDEGFPAGQVRGGEREGANVCPKMLRYFVYLF